MFVSVWPLRAHDVCFTSRTEPLLSNFSNIHSRWIWRVTFPENLTHFTNRSNQTHYFQQSVHAVSCSTCLLNPICLLSTCHTHRTIKSWQPKWLAIQILNSFCNTLYNTHQYVNFWIVSIMTLTFQKKLFAGLFEEFIQHQRDGATSVNYGYISIRSISWRD